MDTNQLIVIRGGGDIATGTICRLHRCGFRLLILETEAPMAIRRSVSLSEAVYEGIQTVEGCTARRVGTLAECSGVWADNRIPVLIDPLARSLDSLRPQVLVDAILAKRNCGTVLNMADITIALGPGFTAGVDVHAVIETARGHDLGRVLYAGSAQPNTGIPGPVQGYTGERVLYAEHSGKLTIVRDIGQEVDKGELIATIGRHPVHASIGGTVRGIIRNTFLVRSGMKIADIDPRPSARNYCTTISDKARCISGGVLEALLELGFLSTKE